MRVVSSLALTLAVVATSALPARATLQPVSRATLAARADAVVVAVVGEPVVEDTSGRLDLVTRVPLHVERTMKGSLVDDVVVTVEGGRIGDVSVQVEDEAVFVPGSRVAVFVARDGGVVRVVGGVLGVVPVATARDVEAVIASLDDDTPRGPVLVQTVRPFFETNGVGWGGEAPVEETFSLHLPGFDTVIEAALVEDRFESALSVWGREGGAPVRLTYGGEIDNDDFGGGNNDENTTHGGAQTLFSSSLAAARTTTVGGDIVDCDIRVFERNLSGTIAWTASVAGAAEDENDLEHTLIHELGHCLGLSHSDVEGALMGAFNGTGTGDERRHLQPDDVAGLQSIYGAGTLSGEGEGEGEGEGDDAPVGCGQGGAGSLAAMAAVVLGWRRRAGRA